MMNTTSGVSSFEKNRTVLRDMAIMYNDREKRST